ncbi:hypothetical protein EDD15DRAFT_2194707 [Pisolithus albus]|nr:hypothetical protein EDD15DRAFT_2194707 [Pisolithus albus]
MARRVTGAHVPLGSAGGRGGGSIGTRIDNKPLTFPASDRIVVLCDQIGIIDQLWGPIDREEEVLRFMTFLQKWNASPFLGTARPITSQTMLVRAYKNYLRDSLSGKIDVKWKIRTSGGAAVGQVKVPVVVWDEGYRMWLQERMICDA